MRFIALLILKSFSDHRETLMDMILKILSNEICQNFEDLHYSVNQYFSNDPCRMFHNHAWVKYSLKEQDRPMGFNITGCEKLCF